MKKVHLIKEILNYYRIHQTYPSSKAPANEIEKESSTLAQNERTAPKAWPPPPPTTTTTTTAGGLGFLKSQFHGANGQRGSTGWSRESTLSIPVVFYGRGGKTNTYRFGGERKRAPPHHIDRSRLLNMAPGMAFAIGLILVVGQLKEGPGTLAKTFTFPEYPYKETTKNVSRPNQFGESPRDGRVSILCTGYGRCLVFWGVALFTAPAS